MAAHSLGYCSQCDYHRTTIFDDIRNRGGGGNPYFARFGTPPPYTPRRKPDYPKIGDLANESNSDEDNELLRKRREIKFEYLVVKTMNGNKEYARCVECRKFMKAEDVVAHECTGLFVSWTADED